MIVWQDKVRTAWWIVKKVKCLQKFLCLCAVWHCIVQDYISWEMPNSLPVDSLMQTSQHVTAGIHDSCIPEYGCPRFSSGVTHFFFSLRRVGHFHCFRTCFVWGLKWCRCVIACHWLLQELISFLFSPERYERATSECQFLFCVDRHLGCHLAHSLHCSIS
jgi:hypothetical protein